MEARQFWKQRERANRMSMHRIQTNTNVYKGPYRVEESVQPNQISNAYSPSVESPNLNGSSDSNNGTLSESDSSIEHTYGSVLNLTPDSQNEVKELNRSQTSDNYVENTSTSPITSPRPSLTVSPTTSPSNTPQVPSRSFSLSSSTPTHSFGTNYSSTELTKNSGEQTPVSLRKSSMGWKDSSKQDFRNNSNSSLFPNIFTSGGSFSDEIGPNSPSQRKLVRETTMGRVIKAETTVRDWNKEFQEITYMPNGIEKYNKIERLAIEFAETASTYARIIISELCLLNSQKTIKPVGLGGVAGGIKYICQGILFKFALDTIVHEKSQLWMYGGNNIDDEAAMKAASQELLGLKTHWLSFIPKLHYPLMTVLDYKGFRVVAMSLLPISKDTIVYGSSDGGLNVHADDDEMNELMQSAGVRMKLKGHLVGTGKQQNKKLIYGPGDVEGHLGKDNKFYVLDFSRLMPPEDPRRSPHNPRAVFYRHLRPELVRKQGEEPLCSDAFTGWDCSDPDEKIENNEAVIKLTDKLYSQIIPRFVANFFEETEKIPKNLNTVDAIEKYLEYLSSQRVHQNGINMRQLGYIRKSALCSFVRKLVLSCAVSRHAKNEIRKLMRERMLSDSTSTSSDAPFIDVFVDYLNSMLQSSEGYWSQSLKEKLLLRFPEILSESEMQADFDLQTAVEMRVIMVVLLKKLKIRITKKSMNAFMSSPPNFLLLFSDVKSMDIGVTHMHVIFMSGALHTLLAAQQFRDLSEKVEPFEKKTMYRKSCKRLLNESLGCFTKSYESSPHCPLIPFLWSKVYYEFTQVTKQEKQIQYYSRLLQLLMKSVNNLPTVWGVKELTSSLQMIAKKYRDEGNITEAEKHELLAQQKEKTEIDPFIARTWVLPGSFFDKEPCDDKCATSGTRY